MKLTLIKPNIGRREDDLYVDDGRMEPLQLGVIAALTPPDVEVVMYDDRMETIPFDEPTDLVAITVETYTARRSYEICAEYKQRGVPVIMGGMHATLIPNEVRQHADSVFLGDAEGLWPNVIEDVRSNKLKPAYKSEPGIPHQNVLPRRDIFKGKGYLPITLMQYGRGCRFSCNFCATSVYFEQKQYKRDINEIIREIEAQERKHIFFVDDNITSDFQAAKKLFRALIPLKIRWVSQSSIDITHDLELMDLMAKCGCLGNVVGFESLNQQNLMESKKSSNLIGNFENYKKSIRILKDFGFQTWAAFTLGYDGDTVESIHETLEFAMDNKFTFAAFNILMPYPNTPFYESLKSENRLLYEDNWWLHPDYRFNNAAFIPAKMNPDELTEACFIARSKFNSISSIIRRAFDFKTNMRNPLRLGFYLSYNPLFRKETFKKQGMRFGLNS